MVDYPSLDEAQHLLFNKTVRDAAEQAQEAARQLFCQRFTRVMGYHPNVTDERVQEFMYANCLRTFYKVGGYWLSSDYDEESESTFLILGTRYFKTPAEIDDLLTDWTQDGTI